MLAFGNEGVIDDAYLYRFREGEYVLVVNAGNLEADWAYLQSAATLNLMFVPAICG